MFFLKRLNIEFEESDHLEEDEDRIYFKICKNKYYLINETSKNNKLLRCFYDMSKDRLSKVFEIFEGILIKRAMVNRRRKTMQIWHEHVQLVSA